MKKKIAVREDGKDKEMELLCAVRENGTEVIRNKAMWSLLLDVVGTLDWAADPWGGGAAMCRPNYEGLKELLRTNYPGEGYWG